MLITDEHQSLNTISRRTFGIGSAALLAAAAFARPSFAQAGMRTVDTWRGPVTIPLNPQRVIAIDSRLDLEPAMALGLPIAGFCDVAAPWVPVPAEVTRLAWPPNIEQILGMNPDLAICTEVEGSEDLWPLTALGAFVPTLPIDYEATWQDNLVRLGGWLGREQAAADFIAGYQAALTAVREHHAVAIASRKVAAVYPNLGGGSVNVLLGIGTSNVTLAGMVLEDLGGRGPDPTGIGEYGAVSMEIVPSVLGDVDAIMVEVDADSHTIAADPRQTAQFQELSQSPVWQRLPAVAAGRIHLSTGTYYGGGYAALHTIEQWNAVYGLIG